MRLELSDQRWPGLRAALRDAADRFAALVLACPDEHRAAVGAWTAAEVAAHTAIVARLNAGLLRDPAAPLGVPELDRLIARTTLGGIAHLNDVALREYPERSPLLLARALRDAVAHLLDHSRALDPGAPATWLGGARLPVAALLAHQLNEILLHGHDIARACGLAWHIPSAEAAFAFELFLVRLLGSEDTGRLFDRGAREGRPLAVEFRSPHTDPVVLGSGGGRITAGPPTGTADARVRFEPAALMLTVFRRVRLARAVLTGRVVVTGPRPWTAVTYLRRMRTP
ncbi:TIGR03083 family protein [Goodfellowiella coeruleoviolacea]|uniref:TIGR03083 family protein n=1 Tax=Goodfellowiella coeruleoviolacea TaxID=334858 RepID=A0AAE3GHZ5_9PSEU|nr:TIGR03083 family protein [Goodfellowiella coeruleoviolacea]